MLVTGLSLAAPLLVVIALWVPEVRRTYVPNPGLSDAAVEAARRVPDDAMLTQLRHPAGATDDAGAAAEPEVDLVGIADKLLAGRVEIPRFPPATIGMPFDPRDLDYGLPPWRLFLASLGVADILLGAYEATGSERYLTAARDVIVGWGRYERRAWLPHGHLWNDNAITARLEVLAGFWGLYRRHPTYDLVTAREVLLFAARTGAAMAKPALFTFSTNHGVMQNLSLWHFTLAFPTLPLAERLRALARERLRDQLRFHVNDEGVVLEHSPAYQRSGMERLGLALRSLTLMDLPVPAEWPAKYEKAREFYAQLRRPDGTLPIFGDTGVERAPIGRLVTLVTDVDADGRARPMYEATSWRPLHPRGFYPVAGYAVWWNGLDAWPDEHRLSQLAIAWSYFRGHAHKHADEMSVGLWAAGQSWWANVGRWPVETRGWEEAVSWAGSNAPHLVGEPERGPRDTRVLRYGWSDAQAFIDLERSGSEPYVPRRQIVQVSPASWVVVDSTSDDREDTTTTTTWTTAHDVTLTAGEEAGAYELASANGGPRLRAFLLGAPAPRLRELRGSLTPFAGWEVGFTEPIPAPAIVLEQSAKDSWAIAVWSLRDAPGGGVTGTPTLAEWAGPERWSLVLPVVDGRIELRRDGATLATVHDGGAPRRETLTLMPAPDYEVERAAIRAAYAEAARKYAPCGSRIYQRDRASRAVVALFVAVELALLVYRRATGRSDAALRAVGLLGWAVVGVALAIVI